MISLTGIAIFVFGNKIDRDTSELVNADGVRKEFEIAIKQGCIPIPIESTGYMAQELWNEVTQNIERFFKGHDIKEEIESLQNESNAENVIKIVVKIIEKINNGE